MDDAGLRHCVSGIGDDAKVRFRPSLGQIPGIPERRYDVIAAVDNRAGDMRDPAGILDELKPEFWRDLQRMEPFGSGNPVPVFVARATKLIQPPRVLKEKHLKLRAVPADPNAK